MPTPPAQSSDVTISWKEINNNSKPKAELKLQRQELVSSKNEAAVENAVFPLEVEQGRITKRENCGRNSCKVPF